MESVMEYHQSISRRSFLQTSSAVALGLAAGVRAQSSNASSKFYAYVGSYTSAPYGGGSEGGIHVFEVNRMAAVRAAR